MSHFRFVDRVENIQPDSLTAFFTLQGTEEFLKDHFEGFPVMPGVLLIETLKQASAHFLKVTGNSQRDFRLVKTEDVKFGQFIKPGTELKVFTRLTSQNGSRSQFEGRIDTMNAGLRNKAMSATLVLEEL